MSRFTPLLTAALTLSAGLALAPIAARANPYFAQQTGKDCAACHQKGRENDGKAGLNPLGQAFLQCGFKFDCSSPAPAGPAAYSPAPRLTPAPISQNRAATFNDNCNNTDRYFIVTTGAGRPSRIGFVLKNRHHVTLMLPPNATFASGCGQFPAAGAAQTFVKFD